MKIIKSGITRPKGFLANGLWCGIKRSKLDLALIYSEKPGVSAAVFTKNSVKAAPVIVTQKNIKNSKAQAFIVNSGNANCFTGKFGLTYAQRTAELFGKLLNIKKEDVLVASTGIIGKPLPFKKIQKSSKKLVNGLSKKNDSKVAKAILTTDLKTKESAVEINVSGKKAHIASCAKGSGMISPDMATMLCFITTDIRIKSNLLKKALRKACDLSFNKITVDGCMSTNDMVSIIANGEAGNKIISKEGKDFTCFCNALNYICLDIAKKIILDAEGATKFIEIKISKAKNDGQAKKAALAIANSILVKTAAFGNNPNWGRVAAAVGALEIKNVTDENLKIKFSPFTKKHIMIDVDLGIGKASATAYTSDLSYEYVRINAEYN